MRFLKPYRGLVAVTLLVLLVDNVGTLLVPTMLANMVNTGITTGDVDYILRNGLYMFIATSMASGGTVLGCYLSARLAANVACDIRNAVYDKSLELAASDFERFGTGSMITRSLNDINVIQQADPADDSVGAAGAVLGRGGHHFCLVHRSRHGHAAGRGGCDRAGGGGLYGG
ncbi:MAG: ABC transporter transmembrane domain-containing protein [Collinsella sp.]